MLVHLNGDILPAPDAKISVFDRGFIFGDGIYEGIRAFDGWVRRVDDHIARMRQGLEEAGIGWDPEALRELCPRLLDANGLRDAFLYWQVTRGTPRPGDPVRTRLATPGTEPSVFGYCVPLPPVEELVEPGRCEAATVTDDRWRKGHVKSISMLANVMAAIEADRAGAEEAILIRDGRVSESCATNVFVVLRDGRGGRELATPPVGDASILAGVTRKILLELLPETRVRPIALGELRAAEEVFLTGTITTIKSVVRIDGRPLGAGAPGPVARDTLARYAGYIRDQVAAATGAAAR
ncbi:MAG TPA: aminotransferase class IV [Phycisphaerales bacterium]|nr:aminotransferase class IV [Phycisphaerales bacterium]